MATSPPPLPPGFVPVQPSAPALPRVIEGPPREPPPQTAVNTERDRVQLERDRASLEAQRRDLAAGPAAQAAEAERKASAFFVRAFGSNHAFERLSIGPRSMVGQSMVDTFPNLLNSLPSGMGNSPDRQVSDSAQDEFIAASLRQDSGAAIPPEELERQRRIYFPMPGDGPQVLEQKRMARIRALEGLVNSAGRSMPAETRAEFGRWLELARQSGAHYPRDGAPEGGAAPDATARAQAPSGTSVRFLDEATPPPPDPNRRDGDLAESVQALFDNGASREQLDGFASRQGLSPFGPELDAAIRYRDRGGRGARVVPYRTETPGPEARAPEMERPGGPQAFATSPAQLDAFGRGAADVASLGMADEVAAAGDTIFNGGTYGENLWRQRGIDEYDQRRHPIARFAGQAAGAVALPSGVARATAVGGARAGARRLALEGGGYGAGYGFGSSEGDFSDRLTSGAVSGLFGAGAGYGLGRGGAAIASRYGRVGENADRAGQLRAAQSARELDIYMPRSVIGGEQAQRWATTVEKTPFGAAPVAAGTARMIDTSQAARDRIAGSVGEVIPPEAIGETAIRGGEGMRSRTSARAGRLYDEAERLTGDTRVPLPTAAAELDRQITELSDTPGVVPEMLSTLQGIRTRLDGEWTPASIRRMRTTLEDQFGSAGMRASDASRRARLITEAAEEDMIGGLRSSGQQDAAQAWRSAADDWRERQSTLQRVIEPILGRNNDRTPEEVTRALMTNARGNGTRLGAFLREIPAEQANSIRASVISQLGRSPPGQQNAAGEAFSLDTFLTHWDQIKGARGQIFDRPTLQALNHLAEVADRARFAGRARNFANTGTPMMASATVKPAFYGAPTALATGHPGLALGAIALSGLIGLSQRGAGKLLASPAFAQRLARTIENPSRTRSIWSGPWVQKLARTEPAIAADLLGFQQSILGRLEGASRSPASRAAAEQDQNVGGE